MGSGKKKTRQLQTEKLEQLKANRKALLLEKGAGKQELKKDKILNHLQAEIKRNLMAIASINAREKVIEKVKQKIVEKTAPGKPDQKKQKSVSAQA